MAQGASAGACTAVRTLSGWDGAGHRTQVGLRCWWSRLGLAWAARRGEREPAAEYKPQTISNS